jgi:hypothetical protein
MWLALLLIVLAVPVCSYSQNVGDLSPNPYNNNSIGNPFSSGGPLSSIRPGIPNGGRAAPTSPYSWSNVSPLPTAPPIYDRADQFRSPNTLSPNVTGNGLGPYGITLPPNHPLGSGSR